MVINEAFPGLWNKRKLESSYSSDAKTFKEFFCCSLSSKCVMKSMIDVKVLNCS
jgi:hypothetical protein